VERLRPHRTPRGPGEITRRRVTESLPALVDPEVIATLHVQDVQIGETITIDVERAGVAAPAPVDETGLARHIPELVPAHVSIQDARLGTFGVEMAHGCVAESHRIAAG